MEKYYFCNFCRNFWEPKYILYMVILYKAWFFKQKTAIMKGQSKQPV